MPDLCVGAPPEGSPQQVLDLLAEHCAPGTVAVGPSVAIAGPTGAREATFVVSDAPQCLRGLVATRSADPVTAKLLSPSGATLATSALPTGVAILGPQGPVCVGETGTYRIVIEGNPRAGLASLRVGVGR